MKTGSSVYRFFVVVALLFFFPNKRIVGKIKVRSEHVRSSQARSGQVGQVGSGDVFGSEITSSVSSEMNFAQTFI